ncbi:2-C-methyl-D-erythritol 4-phosphate cytidylyltransferase [Chlamydia ibidis]|uniref:2-C-methyl-D-erythritol 4-phosphate cytidylyltransferase n=2 Tax=Chlamydia ibidis TaxID=1405396 RepID=S7J5S1_9CHLA|nr:2-C-methyl-D-erythritol 4-phosphate cytidylyltransferase [Chlamydia ibidis]EPP35442.1 2-C-methyl-D-erythritol 4-phosphate cytidylyltransferase [Chlamydia ibidis]EQM63112.1 2-C-methyl-D-erythritol 4-phosphate cytidylyltransferase [Chlamydia ibidis 10-1398/6]
MEPSYSLILLSGGKGNRFGSDQPKQYLPFQGDPLILNSLKIFLQIPKIKEVVVVCDAQYQTVFQNYSVKFAIPGDSRQDSVLSGVLEVSQPWVLVHDGARPFVYLDEVNDIMSAAIISGSATLASPLTYTVKQCSPVKTIARDNLAIVHTPQCLRTEILLEGLCLAKDIGEILTDDTHAAEILGIPTTLVYNKHPQIKITYPQDLTIANALTWER